MKFASVVVVVALSLQLPASSTAFSDPSSSPSSGGWSSSWGWFDNLFGDRSGTEDEETEAIGESLKQKSGISEQASKVKDPTPEQEAANKKKLQDESPNFTHMPTKAQVGVDDHIARLAATLNEQLYDVSLGVLDGFALSTDDHEAEVVVEDLKGIFEPTNPPFAAVVCGTTMIIGWRGSTTPTDWLNDFAWSPCSNIALGPHAKNVKLQGGMTSLALNDLAVHQDTLIAECKKRGIREIVTTGHSLGGGIAQIAHTILRAQMEDESSPWFELNGVNVRSLAFSAPMTTLIVPEGTSDETRMFIDKISANSCNVVYHNDVVPRCYGYGSYMSDCLDDNSSGLGQYLLDGKVWPFLPTKYLVNSLAGMLEKMTTDSDAIKAIVGVWSHYAHPGTIVSYDSYEAVPKTLVDYGAFNKNTGQIDTFRSVKYEPVGRGVNALDCISPNHHAPLSGMEYNNDELH